MNPCSKFSGLGVTANRICPLCGSVLSERGEHTEEWVRSYVEDGKQKRSKLYRTWNAMWNRCTNKSHDQYKYYGARGLAVCREWESFEAYREWAIAQGYDGKLQVDRIDNDKGYYPDNCRLATNQQQMFNRRLPSRKKYGKRYNSTEITNNDIQAILESNESRVVLAKRYGIDPSTITNLRKRHAARN